MRVDDILAIHADQIARYSGDAGKGRGRGHKKSRPLRSSLVPSQNGLPSDINR